MKVLMYVLWGVAALVALLVLLVLVAVVRTLLQGKKVSTYVPKRDEQKEKLYAEKLSAMVQCETVSEPDAEEPEKFRKFHEVLRQLFPKVFETCQVIDLDGNLLLHWKGKKQEDPIMLMSHMDVVPAGSGWSRQPFGGEIADGKVWGRGTADTKSSLMALYQAAEELMQEGYVPPVDVYLCSSCTEEVGGSGAPKIVNWLKEHGIKLALLCDEGGAIITDPIGGVPGNFAMVGMFEKGTGDVKFTARSTGGHASAPGKNTPIARLAALIHHVEKKSPMTKKFSPELEQMFARLAPYASFPLHLVLGNLWLFKPLLKLALPSISPQAGAMLQTTVAFTMQKGSDAHNVIPQEAYVTANLRFIPHQKAEESIAVLRSLAEKYDLELQVLAANDPTAGLDLRGKAYSQVQAAIAQAFPGLPVSPYIVTGATDCRFYGDVCDNCVRFAPVIYGPEQMKGMHGIDENILTACLPGAVQYYKEIIALQE